MSFEHLHKVTWDNFHDIALHWYWVWNDMTSITVLGNSIRFHLIPLIMPRSRYRPYWLSRGLKEKRAACRAIADYENSNHQCSCSSAIRRIMNFCLHSFFIQRSCRVFKKQFSLSVTSDGNLFSFINFNGIIIICLG